MGACSTAKKNLNNKLPASATTHQPTENKIEYNREAK